jgi:hypothetical protein
VIFPLSVNVLELESVMLAAEIVELPPIVEVPLTVIAPLSVAPPFKVAVVPEAVVRDAAVIEAVALDVKVELVLSVIALVPVTPPGPAKLSVAAELVPTVAEPVILSVIPEASVSVTVAPFAMFNCAIVPCGRAATVMLALVFIFTISVLYKLPGYDMPVKPPMFQFADEFQLPVAPPAHVHVNCALTFSPRKSRLIMVKQVSKYLFNMVNNLLADAF